MQSKVDKPRDAFAVEQSDATPFFGKILRENKDFFAVYRTVAGINAVFFFVRRDLHVRMLVQKQGEPFGGEKFSFLTLQSRFFDIHKVKIP